MLCLVVDLCLIVWLLKNLIDQVYRMVMWFSGYFSFIFVFIVVIFFLIDMMMKDVEVVSQCMIMIKKVVNWFMDYEMMAGLFDYVEWRLSLLLS